MRNLPGVTAVVEGSANTEGSINLKHWQSQANSDDLHALYNREIRNDTHYQFHDLFFTLHYADKTARRFRHAVLENFRELVAGETTVEKVKKKLFL